MADVITGSLVYGKTEQDVYEVIRFIGGGSFGRVYEVRDKSRGKSFALKTIETAYLERRDHRALKNEGKLATDIHHPNVIDIFYFHDGEQYPNLPPYMLMEYVAGGTLHRQLESRSSRNFFNLDEMVNVFVQLALGMQAINERLVHRDIKPDNILIDNGIYKISDFGLSKVVGAATRTETFKNIAHIMYRSPEGWRSEDNLPHMDMYSMGIVFFQVATLGFPYRVESGGDVFDKWRNAHLFQQPIDPNQLNPGLDIELSQLIMKMISKRPTERYQNWDEVIQRLQHVENAPADIAGIASLLKKDMESRRKAELEQLENQRKSRVEEENEGFIEYSFGQILQATTQLVERFNRSSEFTKLQIINESRFTFSLSKDGDTTSQHVTVQVEIARNSPQNQFANIAGFNMSTVKAWGIAKAPSGYGFNLVLVSTGQDDLYGEWRVVSKSQVYPDLKSAPKMKPFELQELSTQGSQLISLSRHSENAVFKADHLLPLIEELL